MEEDSRKVWLVSTIKIYAGSRSILRFGVLLISGILLFGVFRERPAGSATQGTFKPVPSISYQFHNHIHGLGYDSENQRLFVATHYGLFILKEGKLFQFGESRDDFMGFSLVPSNPKTIFTSGHPKGGGNMGVMKSEDGGLTFKQIFRGLKGENVDFHSMVVSPANPKILYGWFHGTLYRTKDGGKTWQFPAARGLPSKGLCWGGPCFSADSQKDRVVYSGTPNGLFVSHDFGESWTNMKTPLGAVAGLGVHLSNPQTLLAFTEKLGLAISQNGGKNWERANDGLTLSPKEFLFAFAFDSKKASHVFAATGGHIFRSIDGGKKWAKIL